MDVCCSKCWKINKKEKIFKPLKKEYKAKPADSQLITLLKIGTMSFSRNLPKIQGNCRDQWPSHAAAGMLATGRNLVDTTPNNNFGDN